MSLTEKQHKCEWFCNIFCYLFSIMKICYRSSIYAYAVHAGNIGMLRHLLLDMEKSRSIISEWEKTSPEVQGIRSRFFSTEGGLTLVRPLR